MKEKQDFFTKESLRLKNKNNRKLEIQLHNIDPNESIFRRPAYPIQFESARFDFLHINNQADKYISKNLNVLIQNNSLFKIKKEDYQETIKLLYCFSVWEYLNFFTQNKELIRARKEKIMYNKDLKTIKNYLKEIQLEKTSVSINTSNKTFNFTSPEVISRFVQIVEKNLISDIEMCQKLNKMELIRLQKSIISDPFNPMEASIEHPYRNTLSGAKKELAQRIYMYLSTIMNLNVKHSKTIIHELIGYILFLSGFIDESIILNGSKSIPLNERPKIEYSNIDISIIKKYSQKVNRIEQLAFQI